MRILFLLLSIVIATPIYASNTALPPEVVTFIADRNACDHFRGEPAEGNSPEQIKRREFIIESLEIYCSGTDRRLAALKRRYKDNSAVMKRLSQYEDKIEESNSEPLTRR